uniref:Orf221 n=2 Tax=Spermatophyta TaxID=58024 RepID=A0A068BHR7_BATMA|nr:orf221 [Batis maritima]AIC83418.1 orf221 [Batis maritima]
MFSLMRSPHIFLNLINKPRERMNGDGDVLRPSPVHHHSSAVDVTDQPHSSGQQPCPASSADCQPVQLTSEDSSHPAQHVSSRRRLHSVSQGKTTPEDQQSSPVASSDSVSLSQVRRSSQVSYLVEGFLSYLMNRFPQNIELTSCQFNLLMNLNHLLKPSIILAGEMLCRKKSMPRKKRIRLSLIARRETSHLMQVDLSDQADGSVERYKARLVAKGFLQEY